MCIKPLTRCFYIIPLKAGVIVIAIGEVWISLLSIISIFLYENLNDPENPSASLTFRIKIASDLLIMVFSFLLLVGAFRRKVAWLLPFLVFGLIHIVLIILYIIEKISTKHNSDHDTHIIMKQLVNVIYHAYVWWVVRSFYAEIQEEPESAESFLFGDV